MKITCLQEKLKNALSLVERAIGKNVNLPILSNVLLETKKGRLKIAATNLEIGIETWITSKVEAKGKVTVPAQAFLQFISSLPQDRVSLEAKKQDLKVKSNNFKALLNGLDPKEFPIIPKVKAEPLFKVKSDLLTQGLTQVQPACSFSDTRPEISGVYFHKGNNKEIKMVATDSFRLAQKTININLNKKQDLDLIVPIKTVQELIRIVGTGKRDVECRVKENQIEFRFGDTRIISRLIEGDYPDYEKIIPSKFVTKVVVKRKELEDAIKRASFFSSKINDVRIKTKGSKLAISSRSQKVGENLSLLSAEMEGKELASVFNYNFLLDGLRSITTKKVVFRFSGAEKPVLIKPVGDTSYLYLVMPIKDTR